MNFKLNKKVISMIVAALSVGAGAATININYTPKTPSDIVKCLEVIDSLIADNNGDLLKTAEVIHSTN